MYILCIVSIVGFLAALVIANELEDIAAVTYAKVLPCMLKAMDRNSSEYAKKWKFPSDAAEHYADLIERTKRFRNVPIHIAGHYRGPWIENHFISQFLNKPLSYFRGLIPLFIQFVDIHVYSFDPRGKVNPNVPKHERMFEFISQLIRKDVIYLVVSQDDEGLGDNFRREFPNILVLSAGGCGHVPIPLIKDEIEYRPPPNQFRVTVGFSGTVRMSRADMFQNMHNALSKKSMSMVARPANAHWQQVMQDTLFNLAPRGFGRTSYRLSEIIQMGRIPIHMYDDYEWLPYLGTNASVSSSQFGFSVGGFNVSDIDRLTAEMHEVMKDPNKLSRMLDAVKNVRSLYTYKGLLEQFELFFQDPFGPQGGYLTCAPIPYDAPTH